MKKILSIILSLSLVFTLISCTDKVKEEKLSVSAYAEELFKNKNSFIGDASADMSLLNLMNIEKDLGTYTIELETDSDINSIKLVFNNPVSDSETFDTNMYNRSYLILALIENADEVEWSYPNENDNLITYMSLNKEEASDTLGTNIKDFGKSKKSVEKLLNKIGIE